MATLNEKQQADIEALLEYCMQEKIVGSVANQHFNALFYRYPWQSLIFHRMFHSNCGHRFSEIEKTIRGNLKFVNDFVLLAPLKDDERAIMQIFLNTLEDIVTRQLKPETK